MPLSIACTANLVEACVFEKKGGSVESIRLAYAMSLIRFVNMMTDRYQNKFFAQPIHVIAQEIGIPVWIVNLRHSATHGELPSLSMLKSGVAFALSWLQTDYWEKNEDNDSSGSETDVKVQLWQLLIRYQQEQYMILQMGWSPTNEAITEILSDISDLLENDIVIQHLFTTLLQDGFLVPTDQQIQSLAIGTNDKTNTNNITEIPETFLNLWKPLLKKLSKLKILHNILEPLCQEICKFKSPMMQSAQYLTGWMQLFLEATNTNLPKKNVGSSRHGLVVVSSEVDWHHIFNLCVESPNPYTCHFVQRIIDYLKPPLTPEVKTKVIELTEIYLNQYKEQVFEAIEKDVNKEVVWQPYSIDKLKLQSLKPVASVCNQSQLTDAEKLRNWDRKCKAWQRSQANIDWSKYPLGWLPGQQSDPEYFILRSITCKEKCEEESNNNNRLSFEGYEKISKADFESVEDTRGVEYTTDHLASPHQMIIY
ncbi:ribosomal biogenesis protein LAS1L-like isoform X2 [Antedon mediterranea]